ncbi:hypothetical protein GCM10009544_12070 [Streptomyces stramineus]|uniref:Uncharacterized protein n=1 Tax=Streptomyces stramineus TaxID=173861 RepID=A0ABN0ZKA6_9ACTN
MRARVPHRGGGGGHGPVGPGRGLGSKDPRGAARLREKRYFTLIAVQAAATVLYSVLVEP